VPLCAEEGVVVVVMSMVLDRELRDDLGLGTSTSIISSRVRAAPMPVALVSMVLDRRSRDRGLGVRSWSEEGAAGVEFMSVVRDRRDLGFGTAAEVGPENECDMEV
jgi:hypothetical protein